MSKKELPQEEGAPVASPPENIHEAMLAVYNQVGYVQKKGQIATGTIKYKFAQESEFIAALRPAMIEAGIYQSPIKMTVLTNERIESEKQYGDRLVKTYQHRAVIHAIYKFQHALSDTHILVEAFGEGMDSGDKALNKAMTGANKYALRQAFMIETGDDPDKYPSREDGGVDDDRPKKSVFQNASLRNTFCNNVIDSFERAQTIEEMNTLADLNKPKLEQMEASGNDHDALAVDELRKRFVNRLAALKREAKEAAEFERQKAESGINDEMQY